MKAIIAALAMAGALHAAPPAAIRTVHVEYRLFHDLHEMDGAWSAIYVASDGKVYIGLAHHRAGGHLVCYNPRNDEMRDLGDLTLLTGESESRRGPQSKIHTRFGEGKDGRLYFATHGGFWWGYSRFGTKEGYPGAHWMAYDPKTNRTEDFGIGMPNEGMNSGAYDPVFNRIYGMTHPRGHFACFDVAKRKTVDFGRVNNWESICRTLAIDDQGNVYGTFGEGQIFKLDPRTDELSELSVRLPIRRKGISLGRDYDKSETGWRSVVWDPETRQFFGVEESASILFSFDPKAGKDGEVRTLGQLCVAGFENLREMPFATLSLALGKGRKLYYAPATTEFDYGFASRGLSETHILRHDLGTGKTDDLGVMKLDKGPRIIGISGTDVAADGTIYYLGAVEVTPEAGKPLLAGGKLMNTYYRMALIIYKPVAQKASGQ